MTFAPLAGVRVVDLTSSLAGPTATAILASIGADVVKIERPGCGDEARAWGPPFWEGGSVMFFGANPGKRSVAVDLKAPEGREILLRLVDRADAVVASLRPGAADRLGIGAATLRARNGRLVHATVGAFGARGPLAGEPGYDPLMQAAAGIMSITGEPERAPVRVGASLVDIGTGLWTALAVVSALFEGRGRTLDLSLYETAVALVPYQLAHVLAGGAAPRRSGTAFPLIAPYRVFATSDGELMLAAANDRLFAALCDALELPEVARDPRFATNPLRVEHREALDAALAARLRTFRTDDALGRLRAAGVPVSPVNDLAAVAADEQLHATQILQDVAGRRVVSPPLTVDGERVRYPSAPPLLGEHTREVLAELGYTGGEIDALAAAGVVAAR
ncbi:MAG TPA: CoA transferase [Gaiellaceae bacterium]|nr:CoA transferase [Gaiellaceae bacterium]